MKGTRFADVFPGWYVGFVFIGFLIGTFVSVLAFSALMIRSSQESRRLRLPRIPAATRAQFVLWLPVTLLLVLAYYILLQFSPVEITPLASALVVIPFLAMIFEEWASLLLARDEAGKRIPYAKRIASLKEIHDWHDYECFLHDPRQQAARDICVSTQSTPQGIQQEMQRKYDVSRSSEPMSFHVKQLEEMQIQFYPKDGNPQNHDQKNCGVKAQSRGGKKEQIRVLFLPDDAKYPEKEMSISTASVEQYAEEYIRDHIDPKEATIRKMLSHAVNAAVLARISHNLGALERVRSGC
jgi:hypothetical protein